MRSLVNSIEFVKEVSEMTHRIPLKAIILEPRSSITLLQLFDLVINMSVGQ